MRHTMSFSQGPRDGDEEDDAISLDELEEMEEGVSEDVEEVVEEDDFEDEDFEDETDFSRYLDDDEDDDDDGYDEDDDDWWDEDDEDDEPSYRDLYGDD